MADTCDVCGKEGEIIVCASSMGAISFGYCIDCFNKGLEPYWAMVAYISGAGKFPEDINQAYQNLVREILKGLNISEEQFIKDVNEFIQKIENIDE